MDAKEYAALPLAQVQMVQGFPDRNQDRALVTVDGKPVARLPVTKFGFERSYGEGHYGHLTVTLIAGSADLSSRPPFDPLPSQVRS